VRTATFLFTDIEGSTALLQRVGDDIYARALAGHHALIRSALAACEGSEVDMAGDGFFAGLFALAGVALAAVSAEVRASRESFPSALNSYTEAG